MRRCAVEVLSLQERGVGEGGGMAVVVVCCSKRRELDNRHKTGRLASFGWLHLDFRLCMQGSGPKVNRSTHHFLDCVLLLLFLDG